jgi:DNA-binding GntR family transcriptional regulator
MKSPAAPSGAGVARSALVDDAFARLRDWIITGRLAPGTLLIEMEVAAQLGVQRSHLRQAIQRLQQSGFVIASKIGTYSRTRVAPLTLEDMAELFAMVGAIEGLAARGAAQLAKTKRSALVQTLKRTNAELLRISEGPSADYNRANDLDVSFHRVYVEAGGGPRIQALHAAVKPQADRYERFYAHGLLDRLDLSVVEHDAIIVAIGGGDPDVAQKAVEINWRNAVERFNHAVIPMGGDSAIAGTR